MCITIQDIGHYWYTCGWHVPCFVFLLFLCRIVCETEKAPAMFSDVVSVIVGTEGKSRETFSYLVSLVVVFECCCITCYELTVWVVLYVLLLKMRSGLKTLINLSLWVIFIKECFNEALLSRSGMGNKSHKTFGELYMYFGLHNAKQHVTVY